MATGRPGMANCRVMAEDDAWVSHTIALWCSRSKVLCRDESRKWMLFCCYLLCWGQFVLWEVTRAFLVMGNDSVGWECSQSCVREQVSTLTSAMTLSWRAKEVLPVVHCFLLFIADAGGFSYLSSAPNTRGAELVLGLEQQPINLSIFSYTRTERLMQLSLSAALLTSYHKQSCLQVCPKEIIYPLWKKNQQTNRYWTEIWAFFQIILDWSLWSCALCSCSGSFAGSQRVVQH